jgi:hypothetical protein
MPPWIIDLLVEFRQLANGALDKHIKRDLVTALRHYGLSASDPVNKAEWQNRILRGEPFSEEERRTVLAYCWEDVEPLRGLLAAILSKLPVDLDRALYRGRYTIPAAVSMYTGIPVDESLWLQFLYHRREILKEIIGQHPVYDEDGIFKSDQFAGWLQNLGVIHLWPRTPGGQLSTANDTFECFGRIPEVESLRQIRAIANQLRKPDFTVRQNRNYYSLRPFASVLSGKYV